MVHSFVCSMVRRVFAMSCAVLFTTVVFSPVRGSAQSRSALVHEVVNDASRITLIGNTHPMIGQAKELGPVEEDAPTGQLMLVLKRSPLEEQALESYLQSLQDKNSANYHHWMTPDQFGVRWGAVDSDLAAVKGWLESHGFVVEPM
jgi:Pro-kumamolisin, activation domain